MVQRFREDPHPSVLNLPTPAVNEGNELRSPPPPTVLVVESSSEGSQLAIMYFVSQELPT